MRGRRDSAAPVRGSGSLALLALGLVVALLGAAWWALDADPLRGKALLLVGVATAVVGRALGGRLSARGERLLLVIVSVVALLTVIEVTHLSQVVNDQRAAHLA